ncbi:expressed unknown protein [Ectocarpus siliculosus]|uniref:Uncharacterized protein n=1 Tax=Ectocarpus siliculosus TaxID=2880 RepID=D7FGY1_ECTSI|nr:expressed unknown protein [Ectocarpus siliculosus]|eukprot:CBJ48970.1 expressed unknown protein [Ectocarpus siliculosus]
MVKTCNAQLLLQRLPSFVQNIADFKHHEAGLAILPDYSRQRTHDELRGNPWIAACAPLLLFCSVERMLMNADLEDQLDEKLLDIECDLKMVAEGFIGEHEEQQRQMDVMTDARQYSSCHCHRSEGVGMPPLDVLLEFLRQMGVVVKVRRHLLHAWRRVMLFGDVEFGRLSERIEAVRRSKDTLDHPLILPLARMVESELRVVSFAVRAIHLQETSFVQLQEFVLCQMELRNAITTWERGHLGQVLCRRVKAILMARNGGHEGPPVLQRGSTKGLSFKSPLFFSYSDGTVSQEAVVNGIDGLEGTTTNFAFSIG